MIHHRVLYGSLLMLLFILAACSRQATSPAQPASTAVPAATQAVSAPVAADIAQADLPRNQDGYMDLEPAQLQALLQTGELTLVNVHVPYEGELPETDLFIAFDQIQDQTAQLPDKDAPIVLYCRSGSMSTQAAKTLVELGYTHVYELDGGFNAWAAAGHELLDKQ